MKRLLTALLFSAFAFVGFSTAAMAEPLPIAPVSIEIPENWTQTKDSNEHRLAVLVDPNTENRIEVYRRSATSASHAEVLFSAFYDQLKKNDVNVIDNPKEHRIDLINGEHLNGKYGEFSFEAQNIPISVVTYTFTKKENAFIVVGYFVRANRADGIEIFDAFLKKIVDIDSK